MNFEEIRDYCNAKEHVTEGFPFNDTALVYKVDYAWHFDKKHWIGVNLNMGLSDDLLKSWIDSSYSIVYKSLPAKVRREFES